jgi:hypothetical protein
MPNDKEQPRHCQSGWRHPVKRWVLRGILFGLTPLLRRAAKKPDFARELARHSCVVQVKLMDNSIGRSYVFAAGLVSSHAGLDAAPDVVIAV